MTVRANALFLNEISQCNSIKYTLDKTLMCCSRLKWLLIRVVIIITTGVFLFFQYFSKVTLLKEAARSYV